MRRAGGARFHRRYNSQGMLFGKPLTLKTDGMTGPSRKAKRKLGNPEILQVCPHVPSKYKLEKCKA